MSSLPSFVGEVVIVVHTIYPATTFDNVFVSLSMHAKICYINNLFIQGYCQTKIIRANLYNTPIVMQTRKLYG